MPKKIYFRVFYCKKCQNLYTKEGYSRYCRGGHDFSAFTLEVKKNEKGLDIQILEGAIKYNVG